MNKIIAMARETAASDPGDAALAPAKAAIAGSPLPPGRQDVAFVA